MKMCFFCKSFQITDKFLEKPCCSIYKTTLEMNKSFAALQEQIKNGFKAIETERETIT